MESHSVLKLKVGQRIFSMTLIEYGPAFHLHNEAFA